MSNSVTGSSQEKRTLHWYDQLPRSARAALQDARFDWATRSFLKRFENGMSAKDSAVEIALAKAENRK